MPFPRLLTHRPPLFQCTGSEGAVDQLLRRDPSQPTELYRALFAGTIDGVSKNTCPTSLTVPNLSSIH